MAVHHTEAMHAIITFPVIFLLSAQLRQVCSRVAPSLTLTCLLFCSPCSLPTSILIESQNHLLYLLAANEQTAVGTDATETTNVIKGLGWKRSSEFGCGEVAVMEEEMRGGRACVWVRQNTEEKYTAPTGKICLPIGSMQ